MFYILICLKKECCGIDIMEMVADMTDGRVVLGPGTLYTLLGDFVKQGFIRETAVEMRPRQGGESSITALGGAYYMIKVSLSLILHRIFFRRG